MQAGPSNPDPVAGPSKPRERNLVLEILTIMMNFIQRFHRDLQQGNAHVDYSQTEFPIPIALIDYIKENVVQLEGSHLMQAYMSVLSKPNRKDKLIKSLMKSIESSEAQNINDLDFMQWVIASCLVAAELHDNGFIEAPTVTIETIRVMCVLYHRYNAFAHFGCQVYAYR